MTLTLHLGVFDIPYAFEQEGERKTKTRKGKKKRRVVKSTSTGDVAEILEAKYNLMRTFFEVKEVDIVKALEESVAGALESVVMGAPRSVNPFAAAEQQIEEMFKQFILSREAERVSIPGAPTKAAVKGVSHRRAHPYAKDNPRRPSFYDTGMYVDNFKAWMEER